MSRKQRIEKKVHFLGNHIKGLSGREQVDFALELAEQVAVAPDNAELERILDNFIEESRHIRVTYKTVDRIDKANITRMWLITDIRNRQPIVEVKSGNTYFSFPITTGFEIHTVNEFLRSLDLGINIKFETYLQYGNLICQCHDLLRKTKTPA